LDFPRELDFVQNYLSLESKFVLLMKVPMLGAHNINDKLKPQQYEILVESMKRKNSHGVVPFRHEQDKAFRQWVLPSTADHRRPSRPQLVREIIVALGLIGR
jgi:hypothetical protein